MKANTYLKTTILVAGVMIGVSASASGLTGAGGAAGIATDGSSGNLSVSPLSAATLNSNAAFTIYATVNSVAEILAQNTTIAFPQVTPGATANFQMGVPICVYSNTTNLTFSATSTNNGNLLNSTDQASVIPYTVNMTDINNGMQSFVLPVDGVPQDFQDLRSSFATKPCSLGGAANINLNVRLGETDGSITSGVYSDTLTINVQAY